MKNTQKFAHVDSFHFWEKHYPECSLTSPSEPLDHLHYHFDQWNEYYESVIEDSDIPILLEQLERGIPMNYRDLLHIAKDDHKLVKKLLKRNNFVCLTDNVSSLMVSVARLHRFCYENKKIGNLLFQHAVNCGISHNTIFWLMYDQQGSSGEDYGLDDDFDLNEFIVSFQPNCKAVLAKPRYID